jgi:hypothetical protein
MLDARNVIDSIVGSHNQSCNLITVVIINITYESQN